MYTKQYHAEFDRIWQLIEKSLPQKFSFNYFNSIKDDWELLNLFEKINILTQIITAKNEKNDWILVEGEGENPVYISHLQQATENKKIQKNFITQNPNATPFEVLSMFKPAVKQAIHERSLAYEAKNFRDLFRKNCIPANDDEQDQMQIENLKLINW